MRTFRAHMAAVIGISAVLAAPAWAQGDIDFNAERARSECVRTLPGCEVAAEKAQGMLIFPRVRAVSGGGSDGDGALLVSNKVQGYYRIAGSPDLGLARGESVAQMFMFMTPAALESFRNSSGWQVGANAKVTLIDQGRAADIDAVIAASPVIAYVFGLKGLMGGLSLEGAKITRVGP